MFNKPKWTGPQDRICRYCGNPFLAIRATWRCTPCALEKQKNIAATNRRPKKDFYPFDMKGGAAKSRFRRIYRELNMCNTREELTAHYDKMFKEIKENGIMKWIVDRRDAETAQEHKRKSMRRIKTDYPDTTQLNID